MKRRFSIIILFLLPFFYGCFAHDMGLIIGKTAAFPLTVTIEVVDGVLTGFFGTSTDKEKSKSTTPQDKTYTPKREEKKILRDKEGNIILE